MFSYFSSPKSCCDKFTQVILDPEYNRENNKFSEYILTTVEDSNTQETDCCLKEYHNLNTTLKHGKYDENCQHIKKLKIKRAILILLVSSRSRKNVLAPIYRNNSDVAAEVMKKRDYFCGKSIMTLLDQTVHIYDINYENELDFSITGETEYYLYYKISVYGDHNTFDWCIINNSYIYIDDNFDYFSWVFLPRSPDYYPKNKHNEYQMYVYRKYTQRTNLSHKNAIKMFIDFHSVMTSRYDNYKPISFLNPKQYINLTDVMPLFRNKFDYINLDKTKNGNYSIDPSFIDYIFWIKVGENDGISMMARTYQRGEDKFVYFHLKFEIKENKCTVHYSNFPSIIIRLFCTSPQYYRNFAHNQTEKILNRNQYDDDSNIVIDFIPYDEEKMVVNSNEYLRTMCILDK